MISFQLWFDGEDAPQLTRTEFAHPLLGRKQLAVRGKSCGALACNGATGTFQWTLGVQAFSCLALRAAAASRAAANDDYPAVLEGQRGSLASSLDYAISKCPAWLLDIFGVSATGDPLPKRIFLRYNAECKRPGPVVVAMNTKFLSSNIITIYWKNRLLEDLSEIRELITRIEEQALPRRQFEVAAAA